MEIKRLDIDLKHLKTIDIPYYVITDDLTVILFLKRNEHVCDIPWFLLFDQCKS